MPRREYLDITLPELRELRQLPGAVVIDVREPWEFEEFNDGGVNIPLADIRAKRPLLAPYQHLLVVCSNGTRSKVAALDYGRVPDWDDKRIYHLKGGLLEAEG
jgi:rhodanese-related sulfurtransferase